MPHDSFNWPQGRILQANHYRFRPGERLEHHCIESRMLLWVTSGRGALRVNGMSHQLEPLHWLLLPWGRHTRFHSSVEEPLCVGGIHIIPWHSPRIPPSPGVAHEAGTSQAGVPWRRDRPGLRSFHHHHRALPPALRHLAEAIASRYPADPEGFVESWSKPILVPLLCEIAEALKTAGGGDKSIEVREAETYLHARFPDRVPFEELCRALRLSPSTLRRRFREAHGCGLREFDARLRQDRAEELLRTTSMRIGEVAEAVGFDNPFHFSKWFRERTGQAPRGFRAMRSRL